MKCEDCQLACYDLLDRRLDAKREREVLAHIESCPVCRSFLEEEGARMRSWPRLLGLATRNVALPPDAAERVAHALDVSRGSAPGRGRGDGWAGRRFRGTSRWLAFAASWLVLAGLGGAAFLMRAHYQAAGLALRPGAVAEAEVPAFRLLEQKQVGGLTVPETLPGTLELASGSVVVRLQTGVELALVGPAKADVQDGMRVYLERGQLVARVPHWATGFTVRTRELEVYDLGTVFGVSVEEASSGVFVFKGSVQVNEAGEGGSAATAAGAGVGICEAGEGVLAKAGEAPVKFVADSEASQALFAQVKGCAALKNPDLAFQVTRGIADLWEKRYAPKPGLAVKNRPGGKGSSRAAGAPSSSKRQANPSRPAAAGAQGTELYYAASGGQESWGSAGNWRVYRSSGGGAAGRLPTGRDAVRINAATLAAESGRALVIGRGVSAVCGSFASGFHDYPGTACLRLDGGALTSRTTTVIGMYYPGTATLESGILASGTDLLIGGYGDFGSGRGVVTNNGAALVASRVHVGHEAGTFGRLVHNGGTLECRSADAISSLQIGFNGGVGEFEAKAGFSAGAMGIGHRGASLLPPGTGTVTVAEGAVGTIRSLLRVGNGALFMRGGEVRFQNAAEALANLYVRQDADCQARIRGWGRFTCADADKPLRMMNNGVVVADGEGADRDLDLSLMTLVNNSPRSGLGDAGGWYAVDRGRVLFPRCSQAFLPAKTYCWGDFVDKPVPELVNSAALTFGSPVTCTIRGGYCAPGRSDIPKGLPEHLRPIGMWCVGAYTDKVRSAPASFSSVSLTFRYDHTQLKPADRKLRLYRYDGSAWVQVGACLPGGDNRVSTGVPLAPVASGSYNIGWFALMAAEKGGTVLSVF